MWHHGRPRLTAHVPPPSLALLTAPGTPAPAVSNWLTNYRKRRWKPPSYLEVSVAGQVKPIIGVAKHQAQPFFPAGGQRGQAPGLV